MNVPYITADATGPKHLELDINRAKHAALVDAALGETAAACSTALADAGVAKEDLGCVLAIGGCSRMAMIGALVARAFGREPEAMSAANPEEVAIGAALEGRRMLDGM